MTSTGKARAMGLNHIALEVGDIDAALAFYGRFLDFELRSRSDNMAFIDLGDQFIALARTDGRATDAHRHYGLVVDDQAAALAALDREAIARQGNRVLDPWGNRLELVGYPEIQFTKAAHVLRGMGLDGLEKTEAALDQLAAKDMAPG
jgi:catechol 2,3-dioxygenase-like lactoylglutathione lyase family enzyme